MKMDFSAILEQPFYNLGTNPRNTYKNTEINFEYLLCFFFYMNIMASDAAVLLCFANLELIIMLKHDTLSAFCPDDKCAIKN